MQLLFPALCRSAFLGPFPFVSERFLLCAALVRAGKGIDHWRIGNRAPFEVESSTNEQRLSSFREPLTSDRSGRFAFGRNWQRFLALVNEERIERAQASLLTMLKKTSLDDCRFLDVGCGSGLFSLAARRLGAAVHSFDYDADAVRCALELRRRYCGGDASWGIEQGSALDRAYLASLGQFDVVYSWGVLHHTGRMYDALDNAALPVAPGGALFIAIYNDLGTRTARWRAIKRTYNRLPTALRPTFAAVAGAPNEVKTFARACLAGTPLQYLRSWRDVGDRGMSRWRDIVDWVGGYPYETATPEQIFDFYQARGFRLLTLKCGGVGLGCNEFVFLRDDAGTGNGNVNGRAERGHAIR